MLDMALISSAISSISSAIDIAKSIKEANSSIESATLKMDLAKLMDSLADSRFTIAEIKNLIIEKDEQIDLAEKKLKYLISNEKPEYKNGMYRFERDEGNYCTRCWDDGFKKFRVTRVATPSNTVQCLQCKSTAWTL